MASTKGRKKAVTEDELEEIEGLEDIEIEDEDEIEIEDEEDDEEEPEDEDEDDEDEDEEPAPKAKKSKKATAKVKTREDGRVGTSEVAAHFNVDSRTLRMVLRKHEIPKNEDSGRYEWSGLNDKTVVRIGKLIEKGEAKAVKQEGLQKLKDKKAADAAAAEAATKAKTKKVKKAKKVVVEEDEDDE